MWHADGEPAEVEVVVLLRAVRRTAAATLLARHWPGRGRHDLALPVAGGLLRMGSPLEDVLVFLRAVCAAANDEQTKDRLAAVESTFGKLSKGEKSTGWPTAAKLLSDKGPAIVDQLQAWLGVRIEGSDGNSAYSAYSAGGWPAPIPLGTAPSVPPFPVEVLSPWLAEYASAQSVELQVPVDLPAMLAVGFLAGGLGRKVVIRVRDGFAEPTNLFVMPVLPPGERKTQTFAKSAAPIQMLERETRERMAPIIADAESDYRIAEGRVKNLEGRIARSDDPGERECLRTDLRTAREEFNALEVPPVPVWYTEDDTPAALKAEVIKQGGRMMVASTEAKALENITQFSEQADFDVFLKGHGGDEMRTGRVSRGRSSITDPALTCVLSPQPAVLRGIASNEVLRGRGFLARWLYALPESRVGFRTVAAPAVPSAVRDRYAERMRAVWSIGYDTDADGREVAHVIRFDAEAEAAFREFESWVEPQLAPGNRLASLAGWGNKLTGECVRLAAGMHVADAVGSGTDWRSPVGVGVVGRAVRLCGEYLIPHALAAFALMGADATLNGARRIWKWITDGKRTQFAKRDAFNGLRAWFFPAASA